MTMLVLLLLLANGTDQTRPAAPARPGPFHDSNHDPIRFPASPENLARIFFQVLSDYGDWLITDGAGLAWRPSTREVGETFVPFSTGGVWLRGPEGWQFDSRYSWGGIVFRYGTWLQDFDSRWVWSPGPRRTAPAPIEARHYRIEDDPRYIPPLVRRLAIPPGTEFAYPLGQGLGRVFPEHTEVRYPPGDIGGAKDHTVLVPETLIGQPIRRFQFLR